MPQFDYKQFDSADFFEGFFKHEQKNTYDSYNYQYSNSPSATPKVDNKKYYDVLGLPEHATNEEIKAQLKKLRFKYHPDKHSAPNVDESEAQFKSRRIKNEEMFKNVNNAYDEIMKEILRNTR